MNLDDAIACLKANGYSVTKKRKPAQDRPVLNAIGKPYSEQYDPNYRMKYKPRRYLPSSGGSGVGPGISPERWEVMCKEAAAAWAIFMARGKGDVL